MTQETRDLITKISKEFSEPLYEVAGGKISGSGWVIVDPLSGYLNACGFKNECGELPAKDGRPQVLLIEFENGDKFIPAGSDLPLDGMTDWFWLINN